jgi:pyruvate,orthophosphate dikinase
MCDIEFTIEAGRLWMLQCRIGKRSPRAALRIALDMADDPSLPVDRAEAVRRVADILADPPTEVTQGGGAGPAIAVGLGASPGLASGEIATSPEAAVAAADEGRSVILVRSETSPDDVHGMARSAGVLTATGGLASHAAVVARGWGIPAVVGASGVAVRDSSIAIGGRELPAGAMITIDGGTGEVFEGAVAGRTEVVPEAETLLAWARAAGIAIGARRRADVPAPPDAPASARDGALTTDHLIRALAIKGYATPETLAVAVRAAPEEVTVIVDRLVAEGMAEPSAGQLRLTADGQEVATRLLAADTASWGSERAAAALDAFQALDQRLKSTVTRWQMKEIDGAQAINDHADAAYDAAVLADLGHVHRDVVAWLEPEVERLPRLAAYLERLAAANTAAQQGDQRFVASPRVDSYHSAWFELHEDLIRLAGRTRSQEVDAGRA